MKFKKSNHSLAGALLVSLLSLSFFVSCEKATFGDIPTEDDGRIVFGASGLVTANVTTKAVYPVESLTSFYVSAVKGTPGSDISIFSSAAFTQVPDSDPAVYAGDKWWASTDEGWRFYASNVAMTFGAGGATLTFAGEPVDAVCAYAASPTYGTKNTLSFQHVFARLGTITFNAADGYTVRGITYWIEDFTNTGTYNLFTGAGQSDGTGWTPGEPTLNRGVVIGTLTPENPSMTCPLDGGYTSKAWVVPGEYYLKATWTASRNEWSQTYTEVLSISPVLLEAGKVNNLSLTFTGNELRAEVIIDDTVSWGTPAAGEGTGWGAQAGMGSGIGVFSVAPGRKVSFSPGNLQAIIGAQNADGHTYCVTSWRFAPDQWTVVGSGTAFVPGSVFDLFGWVGSSAEVSSYGVCDMTEAEAAKYYGTSSGDTLMEDWGSIPGVRQACGEGWRTPSSAEWLYLLWERPGAENLYGYGSIAGMNGLIILPDTFILPETCSWTPGVSSYANAFTLGARGTSGSWYDMEAAGAVFLRAGNCRYGIATGGPDNDAFYWTSTPFDGDEAKPLVFGDGWQQFDTARLRIYGNHVRLVRDYDDRVGWQAPGDLEAVVWGGV